MKTSLLLVLLLLFATQTKAQTQTQKVQPFSLEDVRLLDGPFKQAQQTDLKYILAMEPDRLLAPYLREAGLQPKAPSYTNWENTGLDGHIGGHYLSALSMMYASTGNQEIKQRLDYMIRELKRCQDAVGTGFMGGTPGSLQLWKEIKEGNIRAGGFDLNGRWVPLYNIHKTYAGLRDAYVFANNEVALEMLVKLTDWMIDVTAALSEEQMQNMLRSEHGGLNETFADVYALTGEAKYLTLAKRFSHQFVLNPLLEKQDRLTGMHANTQIPKVIGYKRIADLETNAAWDDAARFFWQTVVENRSVSIGGNSVREHFHGADNFEPMMTDREGPETCNTYNMLRLSNMFFQTTMDARFVDYYERALYNHILSSQEPHNGGFVYFTSMRSGHYRVYSQPHTSMWCCVGSGLENHTKYGELIYARADDALLVNLYIPSRLTRKSEGLTLVQETRFPDSNEVNLKFEETPGHAFPLRLRLPEWSNINETELYINNKKIKDPALYMGYLDLNRKWKKGDQVTLRLSMKLEAEQLPDHSNYYSLRYGPVVLAARMGTNDMRGLYADDSRGGHIAHGHQIPLQEIPMLVSEQATLTSNLSKQEGELVFTYQGKTFPEKSLEFIPFFRLHNSRYAVYFMCVNEQEAENIRQTLTRREKLAGELARATVDAVYPGQQQPESDHFIKYDNSQTGMRNNRHFRMAKGYFGYDLKVGTDKATRLTLLVHKDEVKTQPANTRISIGDTELTTAPQATDYDEHFTLLTWQLPQALTQGTYAIRFAPRTEGAQTDRIYEVRIIK